MNFHPILMDVIYGDYKLAKLHAACIVGARLVRQVEI